MIYLNFTTKSGKKLKQVKRTIQTDWGGVTFNQLVEIFKNSSIENESERIKSNLLCLSNATKEEVEALPFDMLEASKPWLSFIDDIGLIEGKAVPEEIESIIIGALPWGKLEAAKQIILNSNSISIIPAIPEVILLYCDIDIRNLPIPESYPIAICFANKLEAFFSKYTILNEYRPNSDQLLAGVERLSQYGFFTTLHALAKGNPLNYDQMLEQPADNIYQTLVLDYELSRYQEKYHKILSEKK